MNKVHFLKIMPRFFQRVLSGNKTAELRKNDRSYQVGDILVLREFYNDKYTGREVVVTVSDIVRTSDFRDGLRNGTCMLSFRKLDKIIF